MEWRPVDVDESSTLYQASKLAGQALQINPNTILEMVQNVYKINFGGLGPMAIEDIPLLGGGACNKLGRVTTFLVMLVVLYLCILLFAKVTGKVNELIITTLIDDETISAEDLDAYRNTFAYVQLRNWYLFAEGAAQTWLRGLITVQVPNLGLILLVNFLTGTIRTVADIETTTNDFFAEGARGAGIGAAKVAGKFLFALLLLLWEWSDIVCDKLLAGWKYTFGPSEAERVLLGLEAAAATLFAGIDAEAELLANPRVKALVDEFYRRGIMVAAPPERTMREIAESARILQSRNIVDLLLRYNIPRESRGDVVLLVGRRMGASGGHNLVRDFADELRREAPALQEPPQAAGVRARGRAAAPSGEPPMRASSRLRAGLPPRGGSTLQGGAVTPYERICMAWVLFSLLRFAILSMNLCHGDTTRYFSATQTTNASATGRVLPAPLLSNLTAVDFVAGNFLTAITDNPTGVVVSDSRPVLFHMPTEDVKQEFFDAMISVPQFRTGLDALSRTLEVAERTRAQVVETYEEVREAAQVASERTMYGARVAGELASQLASYNSVLNTLSYGMVTLFGNGAAAVDLKDLSSEYNRTFTELDRAKTIQQLCQGSNASSEACLAASRSLLGRPAATALPSALPSPSALPQPPRLQLGAPARNVTMLQQTKNESLAVLRSFNFSVANYTELIRDSARFSFAVDDFKNASKELALFLDAQTQPGWLEEKQRRQRESARTGQPTFPEINEYKRTVAGFREFNLILDPSTAAFDNTVISVNATILQIRDAMVQFNESQDALNNLIDVAEGALVVREDVANLSVVLAPEVIAAQSLSVSAESQELRDARNALIGTLTGNLTKLERDLENILSTSVAGLTPRQVQDLVYDELQRRKGSSTMAASSVGQSAKAILQSVGITTWTDFAAFSAGLVAVSELYRRTKEKILAPFATVGNGAATLLAGMYSCLIIIPCSACCKARAKCCSKSRCGKVVCIDTVMLRAGCTSLKRLVLSGGTDLFDMTLALVDALIVLGKPTRNEFLREVFDLLLGASALAMTQLMLEGDVEDFWRRVLDESS
jgi:hypothetical protein